MTRRNLEVDTSRCVLRLRGLRMKHWVHPRGEAQRLLHLRREWQLYSGDALPSISLSIFVLAHLPPEYKDFGFPVTPEHGTRIISKC